MPMNLARIAFRGFLASWFAAWMSLMAAPLKNHPVTVTQPDRTILRCFVSGDEYVNWMHDKDGYTIIQDPDTGYYTYAISVSGMPSPSRYIPGTVDPAIVGLAKHVLPMAKNRQELKALFPGGSTISSEEIVNAPARGSINNIVIFIRFSDESEFGRQAGPYNSMFNSGAAGANSMYNYFKEVSYDQLMVSTTFYPTPAGGYVVSFKDSHPRAYFQPYSAGNPTGYSGDSARTDREHTLLADAVAAIASQVPSSLNIDGDGDGYVDNICFIVKGQPTAWSTLLWPHMWSMSKSAFINNKVVGTYNFQLETTTDTNGVGVLCHEMFHSLGSPDLYHYNQDGLSPVFKWDLMENNLNPPQHMGAYMKMRYGKWISSIHTINASGTYTLNPLISATDNAYRINSPFSSSEYFIVEFRKKTGTFESSLPGEGILVYRINTTLNGQGNRNGPPDEVYIYRPNGTLSSNGTPAGANFNAAVGRTAINDTTNPSSFLSGGAAGGLNILNISDVGSTISFCIQSCGGGTAQAQVTSLSPVSGAAAGGTAKLYAQVKNTGSAALPANALVWFYVTGAGIPSGSSWVGSASVAGLAAGSTQWFEFNWSIPGNITGGSYAYQARVYTESTPISDWSGTQIFGISIPDAASARIISLYPVTGAVIGESSVMWAQVQNTGNSPLPPSALVWYWVGAVGISNPYVGSVSAAGLTPGSTQWFSFAWQIPTGVIPGRTAYYARVFQNSNDPISGWSEGQEFTLSSKPLAQIVSLNPVTGAVIGGNATLWAEVKNAGASPLPESALLWFWVQTGGLPNPWVGYASVAGLAPGESRWQCYNWIIPGTVTAGSAVYFGRVYMDGSTPISGWSDGKDFTIGGGIGVVAAVTAVYPILGATVGGIAALWAEVENVGNTDFPRDAVVKFWISGGNISDHWVGDASVAGLAAGNRNWCRYSWSIPADITPGTYTFWAQVFADSTAISDWSSGQSFAITGGTQGFRPDFIREGILYIRIMRLSRMISAEGAFHTSLGQRPHRYTHLFVASEYANEPSIISARKCQFQNS